MRILGWLLLLGFAVSCTAFGYLPVTGRPSVGILEYIRRTWGVLTRSHAGLAVAAIDPKVPAPADGRWTVYVPADEDLGRIANQLRQQMPPADFAKVAIRALPRGAEVVAEPGLLYLPKPYVVPGGRFNEMYGWDSYFILMGLLRDGDVTLARNMADNALYEIRHYGKILNANRSYYLTRSQPPFLTEMLLDVYRRTQDRKWLAASLPEIEQYYRYWTGQPHLTPQTGLSRYFDSGNGPAPEVISSELDRQGRTDYDLVKAYFRTHHHIADYDASRFYDAGRDQLTGAFYQGDRAMRESGFDPSNRFGPFSADTVHYNPVCLNSLLYLMETQTAEILRLLDRPDAAVWRKRAETRAAAINRLMWDEKSGLYSDYDFTRQAVRNYPFLTTFYPLWAGIASQEQADRVIANLPLFERPGGLQTSTYHSGDQWDAPFGWAPLEWIAIQGMLRYGHRTEAERVALHFLTMVDQQYSRHGVIVEKYDVVRPGASVGRGLRFGYHTNEVGFGWTNAVFTALFDGLSAPARAELQSHGKL